MMKRLRVSAGVLAAVLVALATRVIIVGLTFVAALSGGIVLVLLLASVLLMRHGRGLDPRRPPTPSRGPR
jgi:uncharacterized membrane protein